MNGINERLKLVRKECGLTQEQFAKKMGMAKNFIYLMESGKNPISDRTIKDVCREFSVSEMWLRTGEGNMHDDVLPLDENALLIAQYLDDPNSPMAKAILKFLKIWDTYPEEKKPAILDFIEYALEASKRGDF